MIQLKVYALRCRSHRLSKKGTYKWNLNTIFRSNEWLFANFNKLYLLLLNIYREI